MKVEKIMTKPYGAAIEAINYDLAHYESFDKDPKFERCQEKTEQCRAAIAALKDYEKVKAEVVEKEKARAIAAELGLLWRGQRDEARAELEKFRPRRNWGKTMRASNMSKGPYENHYYALGQPIREIVKQGQELLRLVRLSVGIQKWRGEYQKKALASISPLWAIKHGDARWEVTEQYPQSLGELCIEIAQDEFYYIMPNWEPEFSDARRDIQTLREYLYHKTPPGNPINPGETGEILNFTIEP